MTEHSEMIPGERTSRTPVVQQHARTAECDGFHGRCPAPAQFGPEQVGTIAGTVAGQIARERDEARAYSASLAEDLDDAGATIADYREALTVMQRERDYLRERFLWYENDRDKWREAAGSVTAELNAARSALQAAQDDSGRLAALLDEVLDDVEHVVDGNPDWIDRDMLMDYSERAAAITACKCPDSGTWRRERTVSAVLPAPDDWNSAVRHSLDNPTHILGPYTDDNGNIQMNCDGSGDPYEPSNCDFDTGRKP